MSLTKVEIEHEGNTYELVCDGQRRLIRDTELGRILGLSRARDVRYLAKSHVSSLGVISRYRSAKIGSDGETATRGRPDEGYDFSEEQALFIVAKAETPRATALLKTIITVFLEVTRGSPAAPAVSAEMAEARSMLGQATAMLSQATALVMQAFSVPDLIQRTVAAELHKQNGLLGAHADEIRKTIMQHADRMSGGAKHSSTAWRRPLRGRLVAVWIHCRAAPAALEERPMSQNPPVVKAPVCSACRRRECRVEALIAERHAQSLTLGPAYFPADVAAYTQADLAANHGIAECNRVGRERREADRAQFDLGYQRRIDAYYKGREFARDERE